MSDHGFSEEAFPTIVAHRGASSTRPENTLASFEEAIRIGARIVELDVRLTSDGVPVVMHDPAVDRTTDGSGDVNALMLGEIRRLDAGTPELPQPVPTLAEVLELASGRTAVVLEMKGLPGDRGYDVESRDALVRATHAELERSAFVGPVLIVSFDVGAVGMSREIGPDVPTGLLSIEAVPPRDALELAVKAGHEMVLPGTRSLIPAGPAFVEDAHEAGIRVGTWTVDDPDTVAMLLSWGVDAIASNDPAMALGVLSARAF